MVELTRRRFLILFLAWFICGDASAQSLPGLARDSAGRTFISDLEAFLTSCPASDPALPEILATFRFRRNTAAIAPNMPCTEPAPMTASPTIDLVYVQALRVAYYMDQGRSGLYPWTAGTLYRWLAEQIGGIHFTAIAGGAAAYCCDSFEVPYVAINDSATGINAQIYPLNVLGKLLLLVHEARHRLGPGHVDCAIGPGACDAEFNTANLSSYGTQWWITNLLLSGQLNVGMACSPLLSTYASYDASSLNGWRDRFVANPPPLATVPAAPYGPCLAVPFVNPAGQPNRTMIYYNARESGWGVSANHHSISDKIFAIWYTYDNSGRATWYVMPDMRPYARGAWRGTGYRTSGPPYTQVTFDSSRVTASPMGGVFLLFGAGRSGTFWPWFGRGSLVPVAVAKQDFPADATPVADYNDLWWNALESGWGLSINQEARTLFSVWYTYDGSRNPTWFVMPGGTWSGSEYAGTLYRTSCNGSCEVAGAFDPGRVVASSAGSAILRFASPLSAVFDYSLPETLGSKAITRQPF